MTVWLISVNSNVYNHQSSFDQWGAVDWIQSANYEIGDIIYIYESRQAARIRYKTEVGRLCLVIVMAVSYENLHLKKVRLGIVQDAERR